LSLGEKLLKIQQDDLNHCVEYYKHLNLDANVFVGNNLALVKSAHKIAFTMGIWTLKLSDIPKWATPYLQQLKTDSIQLIPSVVLGNKRTLHLYERACIEDFLRYFYYFDHKIEHLLLQTRPTRFENIDFLIDWVRNYPTLEAHKDQVLNSCNELTSAYKELSRTVHGTTISDIELSDSLKDLHGPLQQPIKERDLMNLIFRNVFFLLSLFHIGELQTFNLDERRLASQHLSREQKRVLSGLR